PVQTSHSLLNDKELELAGINKALIRISVGIESVDDLIEDLEQALM
ncbi:MAG: PLP-dependent transferase, partial [Candidatus Marinimicrobia bacterium]|nr:PLP-dependent transferase [Candidatus Neomarinimicrobiota bacterium]MDP6611105.1 PLP-dependent transferase [Candidatus Neomarinimicrobiota bacterium]